MSRVLGLPIPRVVTDAAARGAQDAARLAVGGTRLWLRQLAGIERLALRELHNRLELAAPRTPAPAHDASPGDPARALAELLNQSVEQSTRDGRAALFQAIVEDLIPDEARILAYLADTEAAALINVENRIPGIGPRQALTNATLLGSRAALSVPDLTRAYVTRLLSAGLLEVGPEDPRLATDYEILLADSAVRAALTETGVAQLPGRASRRTLRLTALGRELWSACRPD